MQAKGKLLLATFRRNMQDYQNFQGEPRFRLVVAEENLTTHKLSVLHQQLPLASHCAKHRGMMAQISRPLLLNGALQLFVK